MVYHLSSIFLLYNFWTQGKCKNAPSSSHKYIPSIGISNFRDNGKKINFMHVKLSHDFNLSCFILFDI